MGVQSWRVNFSFSPRFTGNLQDHHLVHFSAPFSFQASGTFLLPAENIFILLNRYALKSETGDPEDAYFCPDLSTTAGRVLALGRHLETQTLHSL